MSLLTHDPIESVFEPVGEKTTTTFPTQYPGLLVYRPILTALTDCARRERLQISVDSRSRVLWFALTVTVTGDANAVQRFGWFVNALIGRYSYMPYTVA